VAGTLEKIVDDTIYSMMSWMNMFIVMDGDAVSRPCIRLHVRCDELSPSEAFGQLTRHVAVLSCMYSSRESFASLDVKISKNAKTWLQAVSQTNTPIGHVRTATRSGHGQKQY